LETTSARAAWEVDDNGEGNGLDPGLGDGMAGGMVADKPCGAGRSTALSTDVGPNFGDSHSLVASVAEAGPKLGDFSTVGNFFCASSSSSDGALIVGVDPRAIPEDIFSLEIFFTSAGCSATSDNACVASWAALLLSGFAVILFGVGPEAIAEDVFSDAVISTSAGWSATSDTACVACVASWVALSLSRCAVIPCKISGNAEAFSINPLMAFPFTAYNSSSHVRNASFC